jgi:hypothetical protein
LHPKFSRHPDLWALMKIRDGFILHDFAAWHLFAGDA